MGKLRHAQKCAFEGGIRRRQYGILLNELFRREVSDVVSEHLRFAISFSLQRLSRLMQKVLDMNIVTPSACLVQRSMAVSTLIRENDKLSHDAFQKVLTFAMLLRGLLPAQPCPTIYLVGHVQRRGSPLLVYEARPLMAYKLGCIDALPTVIGYRPLKSQQDTISDI